MSFGKIQIDDLQYIGDANKAAKLPFSSSMTFVYGASNTGKSFAVKTLDFMLGGNTELPKIEERDPYNKILMHMTLAGARQVEIERSIAGGSYILREAGKEDRTLASKHDAKDEDNLSQFMLSEMNSLRKKVAIDNSGTLRNLTFRDFASIVLTDELSIQSELSPILSGDKNNATRERNVFKYILTGRDDSSIVPVTKPKEFRTGRKAQAKILQELIDRLNEELQESYPNSDDLSDQKSRIDNTLSRIEEEYAGARASVRSLLDKKRELSLQIAKLDRISSNISLSLHSFAQLNEVYLSDIARLEGLEEVSYLLGLEAAKECKICGAPPEAQKHIHDHDTISKAREAAEREIIKIKNQREELSKTVKDTNHDSIEVMMEIASCQNELAKIEADIVKATPTVDEHQRKLTEIIGIRDHVNNGLSLLKRRKELQDEKGVVEASKPPTPDEAISNGLSTHTAKAFADTVSDVLLEWGFPGGKQVVFDRDSYDLIIDGKERRNNGKGVRAILHAAFKVALLLYCREQERPHPGFLVLDTPLLTYRDPLKSKAGELSADERTLSNTDLKERFFTHLGNIGSNAQFLVFENIDPSKGVDAFAKVQAFTNDPNVGRQGLL